MWLSIISVAYFNHLVEKIFHILVSTILIDTINEITRIETNQRYVTDIELKALAEALDTTYSYLIDGQ